MATGTQEQQVAAQGMDLSQIADVVNRQKIGNQRLRNEMMRQGVTDPNAFALQNKDTLQQAQQPSELRLAGFEQDQSAMQASLANLREMYNLSGDYSNIAQPDANTDLSMPSSGWNDYNISQILSGQNVTLEDLTKGLTMKGVASSSNDQASKMLKSLIDPIYTSSYTKNFLQGLGSQLGVTQAEVDQVARQLAASYYENAGETGSLPFILGRGTAEKYPEQMYAKAYADALMKYAEDKSGNPVSEALRGQALANASDIDKYLRKLRLMDDSGGGLFGEVFDFLDPILDDINPLHETFQNAITDLGGYDSQKEAFNAIAPLMVALFVPGGYGAYINAANSASQGNWTGAALTALQQYGSEYLSNSGYGGAPVESVDASTGAHTIENAGGIFDSGMSLGSVFADRAAQQALLNSTINYAKTGDLESSLLSGAAGVTGGAAEGYITNLLKQQGLSDIASKMFGGAASGGIQSLFSGNNPIAGSLYGSMSGGLHGYLNTLGRGAEGVDLTNQQDQRNKQIAQSATNLAKLFSRNL